MIRPLRQPNNRQVSASIHPGNLFMGPIPGQSLTTKPGSMPYDKPPKFTDVHEALHHIFTTLMNPRVSIQALGILESGVPIDQTAQVILNIGFSEGMWSAPMLTLLYPSLVVMLARMAQAAKIPFRVKSTDGQPIKLPDVLVRLSQAHIEPPQVLQATDAIHKSMNNIAKPNFKKGLASPTKDV